MNMVAISPNLIMNLLQSQNVKRNSVQKIDRRKEVVLMPNAPAALAPHSTSVPSASVLSASAPLVTAPAPASHAPASHASASLAENNTFTTTESIIPERTLEETIASSPFEQINNNNIIINNNTPIL
jgi:hypothetical protein